jgi:hypothetical protein
MLSFDVLTAEAIFVVIVAPLLGVAAVVSWRLVAGIAIGIAISILAHWAAAGAEIGTLFRVLAVHATLGAATIALVAVGALCRRVFADVLDAAACGVTAAVVAGFGVFIIGPAAIDLPAPLLNLALIASPLVAVASAANVDIFRGELLYQLSPIAHRQFEYPAWYSAAGLYGATTAAAALAAASVHRQRPHHLNNVSEGG